MTKELEFQLKSSGLVQKVTDHPCFHQKHNLILSKVERYFSSTVSTLEKINFNFSFSKKKSKVPESSVL